MLDVRRLRLLTELSRRGTIAAVARAVGYTPSAVSQSLARLEREAGMSLLERDGRHVRLTPAARALVTRAERILDELAAAEAELAAAHGSVSGEVVIGAFPSAAALLVVPALGSLGAHHPDLVCSVREHEPEDGIGLLRSGELDLLVTELYEGVEPAPAGGLEHHLLLEEPLLLMLPSDDPAGEPVDLRTLSEARWIGGLAGTQFAVAIERACRAAGFEPDIAHRADEASLLVALAAAGAGVGLLPALACAPVPGVRFAHAAPAPPRRRIAALLRRGAARRPALTAALDALRAGARDRPAVRTQATEPG
jgi:DNA-binding transcriptional LysR family regulator